MTSWPASSPAPEAWYRRPEIWSAVLAVIGIAIAGYLTIVHYRESLLVCSGISDCETVQTSKYAEIFGIPVALLGLLTFVLLLALAIVRILQPERTDMTTMIAFVLIVGAVGFYIYLTYLELFVIDAVCQWCVASSLVMVGMLISESILLRRLLAIPES
jgi:uncharacterized membrane protein